MAELMRNRVYQAIRRAILACEFRPGQELREQALAEKLQVSRSPIRDSLLRLEQEGLVIVLPRQGYLVTPVSGRDIQEMFDLRRLIEPAAAAAAAQASDAAVHTLNQFSGFTGEETYDGANLDYNRALHNAIANLAGNSRLAGVDHDLVDEYGRLVRLSSHAYDAHEIASSAQQHQAIIDAIQAHHPDAAYDLSAAHIAFGQARVIEPLTIVPQPPESALTD